MNLKKEQEEMKKRHAIATAVMPPKPKKKHKTKWQTYFVQGRMTEFIKIGKSFNPRERLPTLQTGSPDELILIAIIDGDKEKALHRKFQADRHHGEWFFPKNILTFLKEKFHQFI